MSPPITSKVAYVARVVAALGCVVLAGRFAYFAVDAAMTPSAPASSASSAPRVRTSGDVAVRVSPTAPVTHGALIRVTMMVNAGPDRSEVWLDDTKLGQTPFIGDVECHAKEPVHVKVIPARGAPLEFSPVCAPPVVRVPAQN